MISIFQYMQAHDEFEIKANKIMQTKLIHIKNFFQVKNIEFYHRNTKFGNIEIIRYVTGYY